MKVIVKEPGRQATIQNIENKLEIYQKIVGGYIEKVNLSNDVILICNEEGKLKKLEPNVYIGDIIRGTIILVGNAGKTFRNLTANEIQVGLLILTMTHI